MRSSLAFQPFVDNITGLKIRGHKFTPRERLQAGITGKSRFEPSLMAGFVLVKGVIQVQKNCFFIRCLAFQLIQNSHSSGYLVHTASAA